MITTVMTTSSTITSTNGMPAPLRFEIADDHPCLPGHFPGRPVVPGVVVLDRVFAAIEIAIEKANASVSETQPGIESWRLPQVKFIQPLLPRQPARIELEALAAAGATAASARWRFKVLREDDGTLIASGEVQVADRSALDRHALVEPGAS
jgi:3-hydroxyacyl-[acyl-carrier-protein] dehydratase